jgi:molecular chaperone IbpA
MNKTVFETLFWDAFANPYASQNTYPPYNIIKVDKDIFVEMSVAGFGIEDLSVEYDGTALEITGTKPGDYVSNTEFLHRGLSNRDFKQKFAVRGQYEVGDVSLTNGILTVKMISKLEVVKPKIQIKDGLREYSQPKLEAKKFDTGD